MRGVRFGGPPCARHRLVLAAGLLAGCASAPPPPDWQASAASALEGAVAAYLAGDARQHGFQSDLARREIARTGRPDLMARAELMLCAAATASLELGPCARFDALRDDAGAAERAYARHVAGETLSRDEIERLPQAQRRAAAAVAGGAASAQALRDIEDPLARLIAVAVLFQAGQASPEMIALASDTASAQGWRRPLLAWLQVQLALADKAGDAEAAQRLRRRLDLASGR